MKELFYYLNFQDSMSIAVFFYFISLLVLLTYSYIFLHYKKFFIPFLLLLFTFSYLSGVYFEYMPEKFVSELSLNYNKTMSKRYNLNKENQKTVDFRIKGNFIYIDEYIKDYACSYSFKQKDSYSKQEWSNPKFCLEKIIKNKINCNNNNVLDCVGLLYQIYYF